MSRKHYIIIAQILNHYATNWPKELPRGAFEKLVQELARAFEGWNPAFNFDRFKTAVYQKEK